VRKNRLHLPGANHRHGPRSIAVECLAADQPLHNLLLAFCQTEVREAVLVGDDLVVHAAEGEEESVEYAGACRYLPSLGVRKPFSSGGSRG